MFARHVGTKSAILLKRVRRLFCSPAAAPQTSMAVRDHTLTGFTKCVPLVDNLTIQTMSTVSSTAEYGAMHKHNPP